MNTKTYISDEIQARRQKLAKTYPKWTAKTLHKHLDDSASKYGSRAYIVTDEREFMYNDVVNLSKKYAKGLHKMGVSQGDHVGIIMANYPELPILKYAISRLGAIAVAFNFQLRSEEFKYVLNHSKSKILITMSSHDGNDYLANLEKIEPGWRSGNRNELIHLEKVLVHPCGGDNVEGLTLLDAALSEDLWEEDLDIDPGGPSDILYTSGTTGSPKAVALSHDSLLRNSYATTYTRAFADRWKILFSLPLYHVFAYAEGLLAATWVGGSIVPRLVFSAEDHLASVEKHRANDILSVPTTTISILEYPNIEKFDLSSLKALFSAAAPSPEWVWRRAVEQLGVTELVTGYGMTEMCGAVLLTLPEDSLEILPKVVGRIKMGGAAASAPDGGICESQVIDPETGHILPPGEAGELTWKGLVTTIGYWNGEKFNSDGAGDWLSSGDLGYEDETGYFQITGRTKEVYKSGGELVLPSEIELIISRIEGVAQCYVVGVPDERWGEVGRAYVVPSLGFTLKPDEVIQTCKQLLANFKVPKSVVIITADELPKTATGKVQKFRMTGEKT